MALLPKLRIKSIPQFPASVVGGDGIEVVRDGGEYTIDLAWGEFATTGDIPADSYVLTYEPVAGTYVLVALSSVIGALVSRIEALEAAPP